ncbi:hypothetical protein AQUCO_03900152v1 [Aquilegia coerulea]|uniref:Uncharacterized protein n=1 Tax=Aquilegia coerulea TaxID=218851 RepID=A0A2G5CRZ9_AQUCA|nr:hypothetical protein AQUCO_03900152v1 [Aquilegia coerulea]
MNSFSSHIVRKKKRSLVSKGFTISRYLQYTYVAHLTIWESVSDYQMTNRAFKKKLSSLVWAVCYHCYQSPQLSC